MYKATKPLPPDQRQLRREWQERHTRLQELVDTTLSTKEAAERYDVPVEALRQSLARYECWYVSSHHPRYFLQDVEIVVTEIRARGHRRPMADLDRPLWFLDDTATHD